MLTENEGKVENIHADLNLSLPCELRSFGALEVLYLLFFFFFNPPSIHYF